MKIEWAECIFFCSIVPNNGLLTADVDRIGDDTHIKVKKYGATIVLRSSFLSSFMTATKMCSITTTEAARMSREYILLYYCDELYWAINSVSCSIGDDTYI